MHKQVLLQVPDGRRVVSDRAYTTVHFRGETSDFSLSLLDVATGCSFAILRNWNTCSNLLDLQHFNAREYVQIISQQKCFAT